MTLKKDSTAVATKEAAKPAKTVVSNLVLGNADDALKLATELQKFVKANNLTTKIQNKDFPNVEAWQFAGSLLGLSPMLESIEDKSDAQQVKWNATVKIISVHSGAEVGRGFATCSNKEPTKKFFADYAICSMAQTRAVGKAYRLALGWLMKAAGYEATPAEEMSDLGTSAEVVTQPAATEAPRVHVVGTVSTQEEIDEREIAGHRTRLLYAKKLEDVIQIWSEVAKHQKPALLADKEKAKSRFAQVTTPQPVRDEQLMKEFVEQPELGMGQPATEAQREEIKRLLNLQTITPGEKAELLKVLYKLDEVRAGQAIFKLLNEIAFREGRDADKEMRKALHTFLYNKGERLGTDEVNRLTALNEDKSVHWQMLRAELMLASETLRNAMALAA
jgi:hypothetical protein